MIVVDGRVEHGHALGKGRECRRSPTYNSWRAMRERCNRPAHPYFDDYGGRGITVCDRWSRFVNFLADMGERPVGMTLDRRDVDADYGPENCRWATPRGQLWNRRTMAAQMELLTGGAYDEPEDLSDLFAPAGTVVIGGIPF